MVIKDVKYLVEQGRSACQSWTGGEFTMRQGQLECGLEIESTYSLLRSYCVQYLMLVLIKTPPTPTESASVLKQLQHRQHHTRAGILAPSIHAKTRHQVTN